MKIIYVGLVSIALTSPAATWSHPRKETALHHSVGRNKVAVMTTEPKVRIRGDSGRTGLSPLEFARWMTAHPSLSYRLQPSFLTASSPTRLLNRSAVSFKAADHDGNGRISAAELADFVDPFGGRRSVPPNT